MKYFGEWSSIDDVYNSFKPDGPREDFPTDEEILFAWYWADAACCSLVVYQREDRLFICHCPLFFQEEGLVGKWAPKEISLNDLCYFSMNHNPVMYRFYYRNLSFVAHQSFLGWIDMIYKLKERNC